MANPDPEIHRNAQEARGGTMPHVVRYVLGLSLVLAVLAMLFLLVWGAAQR
jgi:hypothetical protein